MRIIAISLANGWNKAIFSSRILSGSVSISPVTTPVKMLIKVMPICTVERNFEGFSVCFNTSFADLFPFWLRTSSFDFRDEIIEISAITNKPLININIKIIKISISNV